jgi:ribosomal protein S2
MERNGIHIINSIKLQQKIEEANEAFEKLLHQVKNIIRCYQNKQRHRC